PTSAHPRPQPRLPRPPVETESPLASLVEASVILLCGLGTSPEFQAETTPRLSERQRACWRGVPGWRRELMLRAGHRQRRVSRIETLWFFDSLTEEPSRRVGALPGNLGGEILADQILIIRPQSLGVRALAALGIEVVLAEFPHPGKHLPIVIVHKICVFALAVRRIERVIAEHVVGFLGQVVFRDVVDVLIVSPREVNLIQ